MHDVAVLLTCSASRPSRLGARRVLPAGRRRGRRVRRHALRRRHDGAHPPVVARPPQDAQADGGRLAARWSCSTTWRPTARSRSTTRASIAPQGEDSYGEYVSGAQGDIHDPAASRPDEPLRLEAEHFVECVASGRTPRSDGHDGLHVVQVLEAMQRSLEQGGRRSRSPPAALPCSLRPDPRGPGLHVGDDVELGTAWCSGRTSRCTTGARRRRLPPG